VNHLVPFLPKSRGGRQDEIWGGARAAHSLPASAGRLASPCVLPLPFLPAFSHRRGHQTRPPRARGCRPAASGRLDWLGSVLNGWAQRPSASVWVRFIGPTASGPRPFDPRQHVRRWRYPLRSSHVGPMLPPPATLSLTQIFRGWHSRVALRRRRRDIAGVLPKQRRRVFPHHNSRAACLFSGRRRHRAHSFLDGKQAGALLASSGPGRHGHFPGTKAPATGHPVCSCACVG